MAVAVPTQQTLRVADFSGGLNLRDAPGTLAPNEAPDMMNMTIDERGGLAKRLGYAKDGAMSAFAADCVNLFYSAVLGQLVVQEGVNVRKRTGVGTFSLVKAFSTSARVTFADFKGKLLMLHPVDGLFSYDGATVSGALGSASTKGVDIAVFQNKVWIAVGSAMAAERTRVYFSATGDETNWASAGAGSVDLREVDDAPLVALTGDSGQDIVGRGGLLAFKRSSSYRIHDSTTGAFTTIDGDTGCAGALAVAGFEGVTAVLSDRGVFLTDGVSQLKKVSVRVDPLFSATQLALASADSWCCVAHPSGRYLFSLRRAGSSANDLTLEYDPTVGWIVPYSFGASAFAVLGGTDATVYHTDPGTARFLYKTFTGGSDNGAAVACRYQTRWDELGAARKARVQRVAVRGFGSFTLGLRCDYELGSGLEFPISLASAGFVWGIGVWGDGVWGPDAYEKQTDVWPRVVCHASSFALTEISSLSFTKPPLLGSGTAPEAGAFSVYELLADVQPLGHS